LALYQAKGLDDVDGVLGLAVHPDKNKKNLNYVWNLKNKGLIDKAILSFSVSGPNKEDPSYAIFGGINEAQIVGGIPGLKKIQTFAYRPDWTQSVKQWALEGQNLFYGEEPSIPFNGTVVKMPAIIDTGSNNIGVPEGTFKFLKEKWSKALHDINCIDDDNFCFVMQKCNEISNKLQPIIFQISDVMFELKPSLYLHQAEGDKCQFAIHQNQLRGSSSALFLIGDIMLRHLYQVYDFENETISLGVNKHSQGEIWMYSKGQRPDEAPKIQTEESGFGIDIDSHFDS
jgi:hypothetical protein